MLSKLFKHEMRACSRLLLPIYLVLIVFTLLDRIVINLDVFNGVFVLIPGFITTMYVLSIMAIVIVSFVIIILRFYKNLITDEGFLMFTLPVKTSQLINSKLLAATFWTFISCIATIASIFAVVITPDRWSQLRDGFADLMNQLHIHFGGYGTLFIIEMILIFIVAIIQSILCIYASVAIGQLMNGHKVIGSFAAYIVIHIITQVIGMVGIGVVSLFYNNTNPDITIIVKVLFPIYLLYLVIFCIVYYIVTDYLFKKRLNLE